jgi:hypothetical protein
LKLIDAALIYHPDVAARIDSALIIPDIVCTHWDRLLSGNGSIYVGWGEFDEAGKLRHTYAGAFVFNSGSDEVVSNCLYIKNSLSTEKENPCYFWLSDPVRNVESWIASALLSASLFSTTMMACKYLVWKIR